MDKHKIIKTLAYIVGITGLVGIILLIGYLLNTNKSNNEESDSIPYKEHVIALDDTIIVQSIGMDDYFWEYKLPDTESKGNNQQALLDEGYAVLSPTYSTSELMWVSGYNPGTFSYFAENIQIGSVIDIVAPENWEQSGITDDLIEAKYEIIETLITDSLAEDVFEYTGVPANEMFNQGYEEPLLVIQHGGEGPEVVLHLAKLIAETD